MRRGRRFPRHWHLQPDFPLSGWTASTGPKEAGEPGALPCRPHRRRAAAACTAAPGEPEAVPRGQAAAQGVPRALPGAGAQLPANCVHRQPAAQAAHPPCAERQPTQVGPLPRVHGRVLPGAHGQRLERVELRTALPKGSAPWTVPSPEQRGLGLHLAPWSAWGAQQDLASEPGQAAPGGWPSSNKEWCIEQYSGCQVSFSEASQGRGDGVTKEKSLLTLRPKRAVRNLPEPPMPASVDAETEKQHGKRRREVASSQQKAG